MDKVKIAQEEAANDGQSIYLNYNDMVGLYVAYGLSAYYATMVINPYISYSEAMDMPLALFNRKEILFLRQSLTKLEHTPKNHYHFRMRQPVGTSGYKKWADKALEKHNETIKR